ncbi:MAG: hypothetical protein IPF98_22690 [Gemmatimonadetes bacterium]|nr:hypothetical protein [Gemmatimonadota bacterium]
MPTDEEERIGERIARLSESALLDVLRQDSRRSRLRLTATAVQRLWRRSTVA